MAVDNLVGADNFLAVADILGLEDNLVVADYNFAVRCSLVEIAVDIDCDRKELLVAGALDTLAGERTALSQDFLFF